MLLSQQNQNILGFHNVTNMHQLLLPVRKVVFEKKRKTAFENNFEKQQSLPKKVWKVSLFFVPSRPKLKKLVCRNLPLFSLKFFMFELTFHSHQFVKHHLGVLAAAGFS